MAISHEVLLMTALDTVSAILTMLEDRAYALEAL
jgi:carbamoyl-phosphate synthase large subunit